MDPKKVSQLDPKLKEIYDRVMGTGVSQPQPQPEPKPTPAPAPAAPPVQPPSPAPKENPVSEPQPAIPTESPTIPPPPPAQTANFVPMNSEIAAPAPQAKSDLAQAQTTTLQKKNHFLLILSVVAILVFLAIYALFWVKIFNFQLPFSPRP